MRILIVGGIGFIGSAIQARFSTEAHECVSVSRAPSGLRGTLHPPRGPRCRANDGRLVGVLKLPAVHQAEDCGHQVFQGSIAIGGMPMTMALAGKADHQNAVGSRHTMRMIAPMSAGTESVVPATAT
ncbi:hypothetical protein [Bradyrhizobium jicamae]|jgi:nucleoside-diphosphate-sugar epimerase|uniref:hypothetical protein n=1 Tax=Bradyrhizobium jicamae TaxID=280332 RepID=UPI0012EDC90A|nr:hypothetical protein [Bradyrhizobium jicamae]